MVESQNTELYKRATEQFNVKNGLFFNSDLPNNLTPVVPVEMRQKTVSVIVNASSAVTDLARAPNDKAMYITGFSLTFVKDATCDMADGYAYVAGTIDKLSAVICSWPIITLTAQSMTISQSNCLIRLDPGELLYIVPGTYSAGKRIISGTINYYFGS